MNRSTIPMRPIELEAQEVRVIERWRNTHGPSDGVVATQVVFNVEWEEHQVWVHTFQGTDLWDESFMCPCSGAADALKTAATIHSRFSAGESY